ncbi:MmpS family transport accessory protein [Streptomyces sp. NPDC047002]|uniref:MmpS family transport accessory protein n=1 Tax=Streptomyces sp. NPDC047002 TaxID=3155475 RepID=UPI003456D19C
MTQEPNVPQQPQWGAAFAAEPPKDPGRRPGWSRKRVILPVTAGVFVVGIVIGAAAGGGGGSTDVKAAADAKPLAAPTVTVTATAAPEAKAAAKAEAAPTVTVTATATRTVKAKAPAAPAPAKKKAESAPKGKVLFKVWGSAPSGADITYGSDSENIEGHGLPMSKTLALSDDAMYYDVTAQLSGGGDIHCSVTVEGKTKTGHASGGYNICSAQLSEGIFGGWE